MQLIFKTLVFILEIAISSSTWKTSFFFLKYLLLLINKTKVFFIQLIDAVIDRILDY